MAIPADTNVNIDRLRTLPFLTVSGLLGFGRTTAYDRLRKGTFPVPVRRIGREWRVRAVDVEAFLEVGPESREDDEAPAEKTRAAS